MQRSVIVTRDATGISVWPEGTKLQFNGGEWFDSDCNTRGTNGLSDWDSIERMIGVALKPGERVSILVRIVGEPTTENVPLAY